VKKRFLPLIVLLLTACLLSPAYADVIFEPNNSFFNLHREECTYLNRSFFANGKDGYVNFHSSPNGLISGHFENGTVLHVDWQYQNWGTVSVRTNNSWKDNWVCLDDLSLMYDHISFAEEYKEQIRPYQDEFSDFSRPIESLSFFSYPGAPTPEVTIDLTKNQSILSCLVGTTETPSYISSLFVDESGLSWGYITYIQGIRNVWFCLDHPDKDTFPIRETGQPELIPPADPPSILSEYLPYLLVGGIVFVTASLLILFHIRSRKKKSGLPHS